MAVKHNLNSFARRIRKVAEHIEPAVDDTVRKVALVANQTLITSTPVDKGRARANWQVSIDTAIDAELDSTDVQGTLARNQGVIRGYRNGALIIQNNVPYIKRLNEGWSSQAPAGFVEKAIQTAVHEVSKAKVIR